VNLQVYIEVKRGPSRVDAQFTSHARALALFGRSGAGKTTVADVIAGLIKPNRGRVSIDDETLFDAKRGVFVPAWKRRIGYVFQDARLFPHLDVRRNLLFGSPDDDSALGETADLLGLGDLLDRRPRTLSGGEARRVAIGRALLAKPRLLILDEPLAGLDGARRAELLPYLDRLRCEGPPLIYVSHAVDEVTRIADEIALLAAGAVLEHGPAAKIFDHPEAEAAAGLEAPISVLDGVATGDGPDGTRVALGELTFVAPKLGARPGEKVRIVIDARDVALALNEPRDLSVQNRLPMRITRMEPRTSGIVARLEAPGLVLKSLITPAAAQQLGLERGRTVCALVKATAAARRA
jgi:molybdate transport system ATP-binding protein